MFRLNISSNPLLKQGQLEQVAQDHIQMGFECLHWWRMHNLSVQSIPVFDHHLIFTFICKKGSPQSYRSVSLTSIPQKGCFKATNPGKHFHTHEEHEDDLEGSAWIYDFPLELPFRRARTERQCVLRFFSRISYNLGINK